MYKIVGTKAQGEKVVLELKAVDTQGKTTVTTLMKDPLKFLEQQKTDGLAMKNPERIKIPVDEWKKGNYNLGDMVTMNIKPMGA